MRLLKSTAPLNWADPMTAFITLFGEGWQGWLNAALLVLPFFITLALLIVGRIRSRR